ncbi:YpzG family protein [Caenibacillus caldisaponilyticus]|uniref:YpzG family protein n=1 Tax=Caenibacillus caldisaponilyticus TaxID=1674942 RepID=UPI0018768561|nr:YpzG family protein [Caenibacillus caldisaponilyticus]
MDNRISAASLYKDPFQSPRANAKRSFHQVNGETEQSLHNKILQIQTRKRVPFS